jgi:Holliday junction resolvase RusA-like endonuclease
MSRSLSFSVTGLPQPKGSAKAFLPKGWTRPVITSDNKGLKAWEQAVRYEAQRAANGLFFQDEPVGLAVYFHLPRPKSLPKKVHAHTKRPDLDKLTRAVGDALTGVVWHDDSQLVQIEAMKGYSGDDAPGCTVVVREMPA